MDLEKAFDAITIIIYIIILKCLHWKTGWECMHPITPKTLINPIKPTHRRKEEKEKPVEVIKGGSSSGQQRSNDPDLKTSQSHTIEHDVKIVP